MVLRPTASANPSANPPAATYSSGASGSSGAWAQALPASAARSSMARGRKCTATAYVTGWFGRASTFVRVAR